MPTPRPTPRAVSFWEFFGVAPTDPGPDIDVAVVHALIDVELGAVVVVALPTT